MTADELLTYLQERVEHYQQFYKLSRGQAFMLWYGTEALCLDEDRAYEAVSFDGGNDKAIDLFYVDDDFERVIISTLSLYAAKARVSVKRSSRARGIITTSVSGREVRLIVAGQSL